MKKTIKIKKIIIAVSAIAFSLTKNAFAFDSKYYQIDESSIKIEEIKDVFKGGTIKPTDQIPLNPSTVTVPAPDQLPQPPSGPVINPPTDPGANPGNSWENVNNTIDTIDRIVNLMQKVFEIIEKNQPVVNINVNYANAVPYGVTHWTQLQGWSKPATKKYAFSMKNAYGMEVVKVTYQVHYTYNGNYQGKGKFLTGVTVEPLNVETAWGYKVSLTAEVPDSTIVNVGTHDNPIAAMQVQLKWTVHTIVKDITSKAIYYVQGDGFIKEIGTPFKNALEERNAKALEKVTEGIENTKF